MDLLDDPDVLYNVRQQSKNLEIGLSRLQEKFPDILSFNGEGLMWALDFGDPEAYEVGNHVVIHFVETALSYIIAGFLLNEKQMLCMPFLGKPTAIRFEPSLTVNQHQVSYFLDAIEDVCTIIQNQRYDILFSYIIGRPIADANIHERYEQRPLNNPPQPPPTQDGPTRRKCAFFAHLLGVDDTIKQLPPVVKAYFSEEEQRHLSTWILGAGKIEPDPWVQNEVTLTSATGETVTCQFVGCSVSPEDMMKMSKLEKEELMADYHQVAKDRGLNDIIGLGAFTSVITRGGTSLVNYDEHHYTTGNSFTALASTESLMELARSRGNLRDMGAMVIGAKGSVGRIALMELLLHFGHVNIVGNPRSGVEAMEEVVGDCLVELIKDGYAKSCDTSSSLGQLFALLERSQTSTTEGGRSLIERLRELAAQNNIELPITITTDATTVVDSTNYVLTATNEGKAFLNSDTFQPGTAIFDLARPFDFVASPECNIEVYEGGLVNMPEKVMFGDRNIAHHPAGQNLACLSETIALAMEGVDKNYSIGAKRSFSEAKEVYDICIKQGFSPLSYVNTEGTNSAELESEMVSQELLA